jgi:divalent metal cation (Fe/Co/Zn/Cd) transporter
MTKGGDDMEKIIGLILGGLIGLVAVFAFINSKDQIINSAGLTVLGLIVVTVIIVAIATVAKR